jgi:long-chain acyl-CoA synthetase
MSALWKAIESHARTRGRAIALADADDTCTYGELPGAVYSRAAQLRCADARVLALCMDNCIDWVLWDLAALDAKVVCVPIPPFFSEAQIRHICTSVGVDTVIDSNGLHSPVPNQAAERRQVIPGGTAKITYTSGTTGDPKGVSCGP